MKLVVECDQCTFKEKTNNYNQAEDLVDKHHIPTGHHPTITESEYHSKSFKVV